MKKRYNVALLPAARNNDIVSMASDFHAIAGDYQCGLNSLPHITLCQFYASPKEAEKIWLKIKAIVRPQTLRLSLTRLDCIATDKTHWIYLQPDHRDELMQLHIEIAGMIDGRIGRCFESYDAHLSLVNTAASDYEQITRAYLYTPITDEFYLALGKTGDHGQFLEVIE